MCCSSSRRIALLFLSMPALLSGCSSPPRFDGARSFEYLVRQTDMGPRNPGSAGHSACRAFLVEELSRLADTCIVQSFEHEDFPCTLTNVIGRYNPDCLNRVLLCAHWDTRPWADLDLDPGRRRSPIPGANDGASGVAVLLEIANILSVVSPEKGVDIVFFDAEDSGEGGRSESYCIGSAYYAAHMPRPIPTYGVLIDMIGDRDLDIYVEKYSQMRAPYVVQLIRDHAEGKESFHQDPKYFVHDDHVSLLDAGLACAAVIDFDYEYWHTMEDTPDKCSAKSLKEVGDVLLSIVHR